MARQVSVIDAKYYKRALFTSIDVCGGYDLKLRGLLNCCVPFRCTMKEIETKLEAGWSNFKERIR